MRLATVLLLTACQTRAQIAPRVDVSAPVTQASATASAAPVVLRQPSSSLAVIARFAPEVTVAVFPLGGGVAVSQASATAWSLTAVDRDDRRTELIQKPGANFEVVYAGGASASDVWISVEDENAFPSIQFDTWHVQGANATKRDARFIGVGELRPGQWVALPSHRLPAYLYDEVPSKLENLGGTRDLPKIPSAARLWDVAFLGGGRVCGVGAMKKTGGALDGVAWIAESDGASYTASIGFDDGAQAARVVRGRDGECLVLKPQNKTTDVGRFRAGAITWSKLGRRAAHASAAPSGTIWFFDDDRRELYRTTNADDASLTTYTLPRDVPECPNLEGVTSIAAASDDDVFLASRAACTNDTYALLRTSPRVPIQTWPAPAR